MEKVLDMNNRKYDNIIKKYTQRELGKMYSISRGSICDIINNRKWKELHK